MSRTKSKVSLVLRLLALVIFFIGVYLAVGGAYLIKLGDTWYYSIAGLGLIISAVQIWQGKIAGVWVFLGVFAGTVAWNFYEVGLRFWASVPRLAMLWALAIVLLLLINLFPKNWRTDATKRCAMILGVLLLFGFCGYLVAMLFPHGVIRNEIAITQGQQTERTLAMGGEWREYGRTGEGVRYSPLEQINKDNVDQLEVIWTAQHGQIPDLARISEDQNTPLYVDGTVYHCAYNNVVTAVDGTTGERRWQYDPVASTPVWSRCRSISYIGPAQMPDAATADNNLPGSEVTASGQPASTDRADANAGQTTDATGTIVQQAPSANESCGPRIAVATVDGRLLQLKTSDGTLCESFGQQGIVDLHAGMGANPDGEYMPTTGAILAKDKIVIGGWVMDNRALGEAPGVVRAFDAVSGELEWAWDSGNPNIDKLPPQGETYTRGTPNVWAPISYDPDLNMVYLPTGNASADYWGGARTEANDKYSSSVVAVDLDSGKEVWRFQTTHHDLWDYDLPSQPALLDFPKADGTTVPALVQLTKRGEIFVLDRRTGEPLTKVEEKNVTTGNAVGEYYSPTQPFSTGMPSIGSDDSILDAEHSWGMTPLDHLYCRIRRAKVRWNGLMTPAGTDDYFEYPGNTGGFNWGSASFDQSRNLLVLNNLNWVDINYLIPQDQAKDGHDAGRSEGGPMRGTPYQVFIGYNTLKYLETPCFEPPYGTVTAIDLATQQIKWQIPMGTTEEVGPFGLKTHIPLNVGMPTLGGLLTTKPGISFFAATQDYYLRAIDTETGDILWKDALPVGSQSVPITYIDKKGRQVIVVQAAGARLSKDRGDYLIAYALKDKSE